MSTPRILHILSGDLWGGAETQCLLLLSALKERGDSSASALLFADAECARRFSERNIIYCLADESLSPPAFFSAALAGMREADPELLVAHGYKEGLLAAYASSRLGIPWVAVFHGQSESYRGFRWLKWKLYSSLYKMCAKTSAAAVVCVSHATAKELGLASLKTLSVIRNAAELRNENSSFTLEKQPAICMLGRLVAVKRVDRAIYALSELPEEVNLYLIGDGPERDSLQALAEAKGVQQRVHFLGFREDGAALLSQATLMLITSESEGIPTALLEAMLAGVPVVSSAVGGIPEVFEAVSNYPLHLFEQDDATALVDALKETLAKDSSYLDKEALREKTKEAFSSQRLAAEHSSLYKRILNAKH